ncbi:GNAT family N-acetyltransferase [Microscilla marina]|uniref:Acetyltransferase n=1 Tax=Microscilla marina ATCC 23134 TaxID=313606 RepID=A1ZDX1_MICM2|nr:GNAT family N-acetyltransferase [Microscilla marina]EAY31279.1 acetyltransferase [Microscilla marina ATCC 23134]
MIIRKATIIDMPWANARYDELGFVNSDFNNEFIAIAQQSEERVGIGRLVNISDGIQELGGMYVADSHRKQGIARKIVDFLLEQRSPAHTIYCLAFEHLATFYKSCGFVEVKSPEKTPTEITTKIDWCQSQYPYGNTLLAINEKG